MYNKHKALHLRRFIPWKGQNSSSFRRNGPDRQWLIAGTIKLCITFAPVHTTRWPPPRTGHRRRRHRRWWEVPEFRFPRTMHRAVSPSWSGRCATAPSKTSSTANEHQAAAATGPKKRNSNLLLIKCLRAVLLLSCHGSVSFGTLKVQGAGRILPVRNGFRAKNLLTRAPPRSRSDEWRSEFSGTQVPTEEDAIWYFPCESGRRKWERELRPHGKRILISFTGEWLFNEKIFPTKIKALSTF